MLNSRKTSRLAAAAALCAALAASAQAQEGQQGQQAAPASSPASPTRAQTLAELARLEKAGYYPSRVGTRYPQALWEAEARMQREDGQSAAQEARAAGERGPER